MNVSGKPSDSIRRNILQTAWILIGMLLCLFCYILYIEIAEGQMLTHHPLNSRGLQEISGISRGSIVDSKGRTLAKTDDGVRSYPYGEAAEPVTGYVGVETGSAGIEHYAAMALTGRSAADSHMGPMAQLFSDSSGSTVKLTIDAELQQTAYEALGGRKGAVVVLDADTGAVLVMASSPSFNPEDAAEHWDEISTDKDSVLLNRAVQGLYPPGSTIKPLVAAYALKDGRVKPDEVFECSGVLDVGGGYTIAESHGEVHGRVTLKDALTESCNVTFGTLAGRLGKGGLKEMFSGVSFDETLSGDIESHLAELPDFDSLSPGELAQIGIGQSKLLVTPMAMAMLAEGFVNEGKIMKPYLVDEIISPKGIRTSKTMPTAWKGSIPRSEAKIINSYMEAVVREGTGTAAYVDGVRVTGKTGTAENASGSDHAWFIGTAVIKGKKTAFAVLIENGGGGGSVAAPIVRDLILQMM
ncbi:MAG: cell division protein FtsI [Schwartzia sp.]|nr:cell division protein FtsI [Schwartzia sp. (in: firmicutes)]